MRWLTTLILLFCLVLGVWTVTCYRGLGERLVNCRNNFCVNAAYFWENETFYLRDCEDSILYGLLEQGVLNETSYLHNTCMALFVQGYNTDRMIKNALDPDINTNLTIYRRCCFTDGCNKNFTIFNVMDMDSVIKHELENNNKEVESDDYKANVDGHFQAAEDIQLVLCVVLLGAFCAWPFFYLNKYTKTTFNLTEDQHRPIDEDLLETIPKYENTVNSQRKVNGRLSLAQLIDLFYFMDGRKKEEEEGATFGYGGSKGGSTRSSKTPEQKKREEAKKKEEAAKLREAMETPNDPNDPEIRAKYTYHEILYEAVGEPHSCPKVERSGYPKYDQMLWRLLEHGPYQYNFKPIDLLELLDQAKDIFAAEPAFLHLQPPLVVIGDIRGQYQDLHRWLNIVGYPPRTKILFMGGILDDQALGSVECIAFIAALKIKFPSEVFVIRGVTEVMPFRIYNKDRFNSSKNTAAIEHTIMRLCSQFPVAAKLGKKVLLVHSGISHKLSNLKCFKHVNRPFFDYDIKGLARQIIFNIPTGKVRMYRHEGEQRAEHFGPHAIEQIIRDQNMELIVRARNPSKNGIMWHAKGMMVTIWSAVSKETHCGGNTGVVLEFDKQNNCIIHKMTAAFGPIDPDDETTPPSKKDNSDKETEKEKSFDRAKSQDSVEKIVLPAGLAKRPSKTKKDSKDKMEENKLS